MHNAFSGKTRTGLRAAAALVTALGLTGVVLPAASAAGTPAFDLAVEQHSNNFNSLPASGVATEVDFSVRGIDPSGGPEQMVHDVTVTFTLPTGQVTGRVTAPGCTTVGATATCLLPQVSTYYDAQVVIPVFLTAATGTADGTTATIPITATSPEANPYSNSGYPATVTVVNRANMSVSPSTKQPLLEVPRLTTGTMKSVSVTNTGTQPAQGMTVLLSADSIYLPMQTVPANCKVNSSRSGAVCFLNNVVRPGETYQLDHLATFQLAGTAMITPAGTPLTNYTIGAQPGDELASTVSDWPAPVVSGTGPALTATRTVGTGTPTTTTQSVQQQNFPANYDFFAQDVRPTDGLTTDLAAAGGYFNVIGTAPVKVRVGVQNTGPATLLSRSGLGVAHVRFAVPAGTTASGVSTDCRPVTDDPSASAGDPGYPLYDCYQHYELPAHGADLWEFTLTPAAGVHRATGSTTITSPCCALAGQFPAGWDTDPTNDTATVVVNWGVKAPVSAAKPSLTGETASAGVAPEESVSRSESAGADIR